MKKFRPFLACLLACLLLTVTALADDEAGGPADDSSGSEDTPSVSEPAPSPSEDAPSAPEPDPPAPDPDPAPPDDAAPAPDPLPDAPENTPDPVPDSPEDVPPLTEDAPLDPPEGSVSPPDTSTDTDYYIPSEPSTDYYSPSQGSFGGGIDTYETTTDAGTSIVLVDVQGHDMLSVPSFSGSSLFTLDDGGDSTITQVMRNLFGTYTPRTQTVTTYYDGQPISVDEQVIPGIAGIDWEWVAGVCVFALMLWCLFRLLGGVMRYG